MFSAAKRALRRRGVPCVAAARRVRDSVLAVGLGLGVALPAAPALADMALTPKLPQIAYLGGVPDKALGSGDSKDLLFLSMADLPTPEEAELKVFAALLRANPVTRLTSSIQSDANFSDQLLLLADLTLGGDTTAQTVGIGGQTLSLDQFSAHSRAFVEAINPTQRAVAFVRISDPGSLAPAAIPGIRAMAEALGFGMTVVTIIEAGEIYGCDTARGEAIPRDLISGVADRTPFGDGDGASSLAEVEAYVVGALERHANRSSTCGAMYSFILNGADDPGAALLRHDQSETVADVESAVYHETFEAMFLQKASAEAELLSYLGTCEFCPLETELNDRLTTMRRTAVERQLEGQIWAAIKDDGTPERLSIYLESCKHCEFRAEAEKKIEDIALSAKYGAAESEVWRAASASRDPAAIRAYAENCKYCGHRQEALALADEIERDSVFAAEAAQYAQAIETRDITLARAYIDDCSYCANRDEMTVWLEAEERRAELLAPCLKFAGLPQTGGPRKLEEIDRFAARQACTAASDAFPEDGEIATYLGRVAQASGDLNQAADAYSKGVAAGIPAAYGLAAYLSYAPAEGEQPDMREAERLALIGSDAGDWLSKELLTVLYAKQLIDGRSPADAYKVARPNAEDGNPIAQYFVGFFYQSGTGVATSPETAAFWYEKAVGQQYTHAYPYLADLLETGDGVSQDTDRAADLYWQGVTKGDETALTRLTTELSDRDREVVREVQRRLREAGFYRGSVDGIPGPSTVNALNVYHENISGAG